MTEKEIKDAARFLAIERFACHTHNMVLRLLSDATGTSMADLNAAEEQSIEPLRLLPALGLPPEVSDVVADETFHELKRLIAYAREMRSGIG